MNMSLDEFNYLNAYLDKLIRLQESGVHVKREINDVVRILHSQLHLDASDIDVCGDDDGEAPVSHFVDALRGRDGVRVYDVKSSGYIDGRWVEGCDCPAYSCDCDCAGGSFRVRGKATVIVIEW